jgi:hypothetical protein
MSIRTDGVMAELLARRRAESPTARAARVPRQGIFARLVRALVQRDGGIDGLDERLRADVGLSHEIGWGERVIRRYVAGGNIWTGE